MNLNKIEILWVVQTVLHLGLGGVYEHTQSQTDTQTPLA